MNETCINYTVNISWDKAHTTVRRKEIANCFKIICEDLGLYPRIITVREKDTRCMRLFARRDLNRQCVGGLEFSIEDEFTGDEIDAVINKDINDLTFGLYQSGIDFIFARDFESRVLTFDTETPEPTPLEINLYTDDNEA